MRAYTVLRLAFSSIKRSYRSSNKDYTIFIIVNQCFAVGSKKTSSNIVVLYKFTSNTIRLISNRRIFIRNLFSRWIFSTAIIRYKFKLEISIHVMAVSVPDAILIKFYVRYICIIYTYILGVLWNNFSLN